MDGESVFFRSAKSGHDVIGASPVLVDGVSFFVELDVHLLVGISA